MELIQKELYTTFSELPEEQMEVSKNPWKVRIKFEVLLGGSRNIEDDPL